VDKLKRSNSFQKLRATIRHNSVRFVQKLKGDIDFHLNNLSNAETVSHMAMPFDEACSAGNNETKPKIVNSASALGYSGR
jgi:hypothetical protein